jgi:alpha-ribazole phosphatase
MVETLYLIRHGETEGMVPKRYKGTLDVPLSVRGVGQAQALARHMRARLARGKSLAAVYCSDLSRAVKTAEPLAGAFGLEPRILPSLRERNFGRWEGLTFDEIRDRFPGEFEAWMRDPLEHSPVGGESTRETRERALQGWREVQALHRGGDVAVVSHGGVNRVLLCEFLGVPLANIFRLEQDAGCLNVVRFYEGYPVLKLLNGNVTEGIDEDSEEPGG